MSQRGYTLENTAAEVVNEDLTIHRSAGNHNQLHGGMTWRRKYIAKITRNNVHCKAINVPTLAKKLELVTRDDRQPDAVVRSGCKYGGCEHVFDEAILD